jgi:cysteine desulfurase/selenocysteine lyase
MESSWRDDFEALDAQVYGHPLAYLDSAATTQMPRPVVERLSAYYAHEHANVHRGVHYLSERATDALEAARAHVASCLHAGDPREVIFTSGATDSLNMAARGLAQLLEPGSAVVVSDLEHHSDYVPWQRVCEERGARFVLWRSRDGRLDLGELARLLDAHPVRVVAVTQVSNVTGTVLDLRAVAKLAHEHGALVVADGAQGILHEGVDVTAVGVDLYAFSAHKMFGPTGTGVLWGRRDVLERMEPVRLGGGMVDEVGDEATSWA